MKNRGRESDEAKRRHVRIYFSAEEFERLEKLAKADDFEGQLGVWLAWKIRRLLRELEEKS